MTNKIFLRNIDYNSLLEAFLVSSVATILIVRFYLIITNFPKIGGGGLHIAHMLWGGILLVIALFLCLFFFSRILQRIAAIVGGIGFGLFIDELGKFVTSDNNYFFKPTFAMIYVIFILLYISSRAIGRRSFSPQEYLVNAIELAKEVIIGDLDISEKKKALEYLRLSRTKNAFVLSLEKEIAYISARRQRLNRLRVFQSSIKNFYNTIRAKPWFQNVISAFFILQAVITLAIALIFAFGLGLDFFKNVVPREVFLAIKHITFSDKIEFFGSAFSGVLVIIGVAMLRRSKLRAYQFFKWSILASIFITQVFSFYNIELLAVFGLALNLLILSAINYMIVLEQMIPLKSR